MGLDRKWSKPTRSYMDEFTTKNVVQQACVEWRSRGASGLEESMCVCVCGEAAIGGRKGGGGQGGGALPNQLPMPTPCPQLHPSRTQP